jgi:hypothetical protein
MKVTDPVFSDQAKALAYFEALTLPNGPFCPHCGETKRIYRLEGKSHRPGLIHCNACDGSFTVRTATAWRLAESAIALGWMETS